MSSAPESEEAAQELIGSVLSGRYRIECLLGSGGMGSVYRAEHVHMRKSMAVKILHREMTMLPEVVARFEREAVAAGRIDHPHVAAATDFGRLDDGSFFMVLEFVEGRSLSALLKAEGPMNERRALRIARQIADALACAHGAGIVHRDLKPENVMLLERENASDFVKVLDFGIAKVKLEASTGEQQLTQLGVVFGTPEYMSPEQAQGLEVDARSDLYTLGVMLYEMLAGRSPFRHEELVVVLTRQITAAPPPLRDSVTPETQQLVSALLAKKPEQRPQSAVELRARIDQLLRDAPSASEERPLPPEELGNRITEADVAHAHTALALPDVAAPPVSRLAALVQRAGLDRPLALAGYAVPLGFVLGAVAVLVVVLVLAATLVAVSGKDDPKAAALVPTAPSDPDLVAIVARAETGDRAALAFLASRPKSKRTSVEWRALGHGACRNGEYAACLAAYADGLSHDPALARDSTVLVDVRRAVEQAAVSEQALALAAGPLGPAGADLLYDVSETGKGQTPSAAAKRAKDLLETEPTKVQRSPALNAVMELQSALRRPKCADLKRVLVTVAQHADERALPSLNRLAERRGCGFLGLSDCYSCLRVGKELSQARDAARGRPRPSFGARAAAPAPRSSAKPKTER